ncbi:MULTISPECIES: type II CAAX prenyl endopeptidase Rce1 family protein [Haloferax]|uniref:CPBP family intramembrane metalloprotease n=1 Tax=Haloferax marinum TaxID=2666143 RepID=A0A6A8G4B1_9EURY|nr:MULTISPECIES: CPBP family intramembrane glutamic endopeptidase [Haloferax]KAB1197038.1 CPBP family intramembrane metalloprotease [Haloferax sp. CBA1150]MRW96064.1 CPBP family intramembrane metalloprotease [Haloferax marinum]
MLRRRFARLPWLYRALLAGGVIGAAWSLWPIPSGDLTYRAVHDALLFILVPGALAVSHGRNLGWRVDRAALRNTVLLALFVLPFYLVGSSLPTIRTYYPMWHTSTALVEFVPHAAQQLLVVVAAETYYRGLLCVGVRDIGRKSALISPILYAFHHVGKPPIELLLSAPTDVLFGLVDYESDSILPSIVAHGFGLVLLDWLVLHPPLFPPDEVAAALQWLPIPL